MGKLKYAKDSSETVTTSTDDLYCLDDSAEEKEWNIAAVVEKTVPSKYLHCYHLCQGRFYAWNLN